ncbi:hypothetical protein H2200_002182 [Cladophialophora chaetospira]|uniref:Uncharacterized protein n=1 Tax=Cladophialophora chaetospira TaxID=386627 RepID=A0AA39CLW7_9EURO|nr:hypothetical protein H2200_002182 [Cladophialophora chaetospira]
MQPLPKTEENVAFKIEGGLQDLQNPCVAAGRDCGGYDDVPKPWIFEYETDRTSNSSEKENFTEGSQSPVTNLGISVFDGMFSSPYTTRASKFAVQHWLQLTNPDNCSVANALQITLGSYVPQAAWHLGAVRHCLLSAASAAAALEARSSNMGHRMESSLSKQSIIHMHLAIRAILKETQMSIELALSAMMMFVICAWLGRWEDCKRNLYFCSKLSHELRAEGVHVIDDLLAAVDTMVEVMRLLPPFPTTKAARMSYACRALTSARLWIDRVAPVLGQTPRSDLMHHLLQAYRTRIIWIECQWRSPGQNKIKINPMRVEDTAFAPGALHMQTWTEKNEDFADFDLRLFAAQLSMALKLTLIYGAAGDARRLREAAFACHGKLQGFYCTLDSENPPPTTLRRSPDLATMLDTLGR